VIRVFLAGVVLAIRFPVPALPAEQGQLDASPALFSVLAAINAAGYDAELDSPANSPLRAQIRKELASRTIPCLEELRYFFRKHRQKDWTAELSQYVSFALSVNGPPEFKSRFLSHLIPPDVAPLEGFDALMARFYKEAGLEQLWQQAEPAFEQAIARYQQPAARALLEVNAYLRSAISGYLGRHFQVYVDLLGAPNQIHTRNYVDDYYIVLTPSPEPQADDIRHAYLHYMLDPLVMRNSEELNKKRGLIDYAQGAPYLEEQYKSDFLLLATECLIKAVEARLAKKPALVDQALREGYVMAPCFAELLPVYERQEQSMRFYFPELVKGIDLRKEERRLEKIEFASERPVRKAKVVSAEIRIQPSGPQKTLEEAEQYYASRDLEKASEAYRRLLQETDERSLHARAYYGLARIALLRNDPELAVKLFQRVLDSAPDPQTKAWAYVYLARLADAAGERPRAVENYQAALGVQGASAAAREAAEKGLKEAFTKKP
jgi:tetratricopeptide (TPR) repeat protein